MEMQNGIRFDRSKEDLVIEKPFGLAILSGKDRNVVYARIINIWVRFIYSNKNFILLKFNRISIILHYKYLNYILCGQISSNLNFNFDISILLWYVFREKG